MKRLFISQPMRGKTDEEILAVRVKVVESVERELGEKVEVIDSFFQEAPVDVKPLWYLAKSLELLSTADVAYFAEGWEEARGCRIENTCAIEYGIELVIEAHKDHQKRNTMDEATDAKARKECREMTKDFLQQINLVRCLIEGAQPGMGNIFIDVLVEELQKLKTKREEI